MTVSGVTSGSQHLQQGRGKRPGGGGGPTQQSRQPCPTPLSSSAPAQGPLVSGTSGRPRLPGSATLEAGGLILLAIYTLTPTCTLTDVHTHSHTQTTLPHDLFSPKYI